MIDYLLPLILILVSALTLRAKEDLYHHLYSGAAEGLSLLASVAPSLVLLLTAVSALRASGALELLEQALSPLLHFSGIPAETLPLLLIRPISGSAALAVAADLMTVYGPDSPIGRTAAIMLGSTETTFYTISVYCGAAGIRKTGRTVLAALCADLVGFLAASFSQRLFFGN